MNRIRREVKTWGLLIMLALSAALGGAGCANTGGAGARDQVISISNREVAALSAEDIVRMMQLAGFSEQQILELGTEVRNALALSGTAQVKRKDRVEALFSVQGDQIYVITRSGGSFIYSLADKMSSPPPRGGD